MALETLKDVKRIAGFDLLQDRPRLENGEVDWKTFDKLRKDYPIYVDHEADMISFKIQNGPIKEVGVNGCQVADVIAVAKHIIEELNKKFPCDENSMTIVNLEEALMWQDRRTKNRESRNVEGLSIA